MRLVDFDFDLPKERIAQEPVKLRDHSRLMVLDRQGKSIKHDYFYNLGKYLRAGDMMVFNDTKVFPARLVGHKETGGEVEILLLNRTSGWNFIGKNIGSAKKILFKQGLVGEIVNKQIFFNKNKEDMKCYMDKYGQVPYPPYIKAVRSLGKRYQTVYAKHLGSAAAPTAGFHFSNKLIKRLRDEGIKTEFITLHVGLGTFAPIKTEEIEDHEIHSEWFSINKQTISDIKSAKRVVAVGTTTVRTLETWARTGDTSGETDMYIYPGFNFKVVKAMVTNFHMPRSSLVLLVAAFAGREFILEAYNLAITMGYRFGSFGDAMLII